MPYLSDLGFSPHTLQKLVEQGYISRQTHPKYPELAIYNYTHKTQIERYWNLYTRTCRGLILKESGGSGDDPYIIAQGLPKFFNYNDPSQPETHPARLPKVKPFIQEKLDGSLGILWKYGNEYGIATRGSFTSEQALWATDWLKRHISHLHLQGKMFAFQQPSHTQCFEIIYKKNRIVVDYDFEGLVLLAGVRNGSIGRELALENLRVLAQNNHMRLVSRVPKTLSACLAEDTPNAEGYVAVYKYVHSASQTTKTLRIKIKHPSYVMLHKIITGVNPKDVWESLKNNEATDILSKPIPESFREWYTKWEQRLRDDYQRVEAEVNKAYDACPLDKDPHDRDKRKALAEYFNEHHPTIAGLLFSKLDGQPISNAIWDSIKPKGTDSYLKQEEVAA